jgi:hypothetical protein
VRLPNANVRIPENVINLGTNARKQKTIFQVSKIWVLVKKLITPDYNKIKTVENHTFESLKKLTQVDLTGNPFIEDDKNVFLKGLLKYGTEGKAIYGGIFPELDARQKYR